MKAKIYSKEYFGNIASWVFVLSCFAYPISAILSMILNVSSTMFNGFYRGIIVALSLYIIIFYRTIYKFQYLRNKQTSVLLFFLVLYTFKVIWDKSVGEVVSEHTNSYIFLFLFGGVLFPVMAITLTMQYADIKKVIIKIFYTLAIGNALLFIYFLYQNNWHLDTSMLLTRAEIRGEEEGSFVVNPIAYGFYGGLLFLFCFSIKILYRNELTKNKKIIMTFFLFLGLLNLLMSNSRGPILASTLGLIVIVVIYVLRDKSSSKRVLNFLGILIVVSGLIYFISSKIASNNLEIGILIRFDRMLENVNTGEKDDREILYSEAFQMFNEYPIIGNQFVLRSTQSYPHSAVFEVLMSLGLVGLFFYLLIIKNLVVKMYCYKQESIYFPIFMGLVTVTFIMSLTTGNLYQNVENWNMMAVFFSISSLSNKLL